MGPKRSKSEPNKPRVEPVSVIFVPQTRFGALASKLKQDEVALTQITGEKLKVTERSGTTVEQLLISSNPWQAGDCGRESCLVCRHGDGKQVCDKRRLRRLPKVNKVMLVKMIPKKLWRSVKRFQNSHVIQENQR